MRRLAFTILALGIAGWFATAPALAQPPDGAGRLAGRFARVDRNNDKVVDSAEVAQAADRVFKRLLERGDKNGNGMLELDEARALRERVTRPRGSMTRPAGRPPLAAMDTDRDGQITREEFTGPAPAFARLDANADGKLTREELRAARPPGGRRPGARPGGPPAATASQDEKPLPKAARDPEKPGPAARLARINEMDVNNDSKVTRDEFKGPAAAFDHLDGDGDGVLTSKDAEIREASRPGAGAGAAGRGPGAAGRGPGAAGRGPGTGGGRFAGRFRDLDSDKNGSISREEFKGPAAAFDRLDSNKDGAISREDRPAGRGGSGQGGRGRTL